MSNVIQATAHRRRTDRVPRPGLRQPDSGVSPLASGSSRGIALFISR